MRALCVVAALLLTAPAVAAPSEAGEKLRQAREQLIAGEPEAALALVDAGLAAAPSDKELLLLRGHVLVQLSDYQGALAAYRRYLESGARGGNRREVVRIIDSLESASTTFLEVNVENGPAEVRVDARAGKPFCVASPSCKRGIMPGDHLVIVERPGFQRVARRVEVVAAAVTPLQLTLVEKPSPFRIAVIPTDATVTVDGAPAPAEVAPGEHTVEVRRAGYLPLAGKLRAALGKPIQLEVGLEVGIPVEVTPPEASLTVDGQPVTIVEGMVPAGRVIAARAPGYRTVSVTVPAAVSAGQPVRITLTPAGAMLAIAGAPDGALLRVDGSPRGYLPLETPLALDPGEHTVEVSLDGRLPYRERVAVEPSQQTTVRLDGLRRRTKTKTFIASAVMVGGFATGSVFGFLALDREEQYNARAQAPEIARNDPTLVALGKEADRYALIADVSFAASLVGLVAGIYFARTEGRGVSEARIEVRPLPGGVALSGRF
jgi:hypothetical protein